MFRSNHNTQPKPEWIPIDVELAGICETDLQLVQGYMGFEGVLGHEFVGIAKAGKFKGQRVVGEINCFCNQCEFCDSGLGGHCPNRTVLGILNHDGAFADTVYLPEQNLHAVPDFVPNTEAVFTEPLAAAFQIPAQIDLSVYEKVAVVGDGRLGYLIAQVLNQLVPEVTVIGKHSKKLTRFEDHEIKTRLLGDNLQKEFTLVVDCTGSPTGIPTALSLLKPRGTLVLKTTVAGEFPTNLAGVVIDEITVVGSRCGPFDKALEALENKRIEVESLITGRYSLENVRQAFDAASDPAHQKILLEFK